MEAPKKFAVKFSVHLSMNKEAGERAEGKPFPGKCSYVRIRKVASPPFQTCRIGGAMLFWFMVFYVAMLVAGVVVGIWHYRRDLPKKNREGVNGRVGAEDRCGEGNDGEEP